MFSNPKLLRLRSSVVAVYQKTYNGKKGFLATKIYNNIRDKRPCSAIAPLSVDAVEPINRALNAQGFSGPAFGMLLLKENH